MKFHQATIPLWHGVIYLLRRWLRLIRPYGLRAGKALTVVGSSENTWFC